MKSILLYHIYPINHWKKISDELLAHLHFSKVVVHVSLPEDKAGIRDEVESYLAGKKIDQILWSTNSGKGEPDALRRFLTEVKLSGFDVFTYMHCKGVSKPENDHIKAWNQLMHYFIIERTDLCERAFRSGYLAYGVNKSYPDPKDVGFLGSSFFYEGNFININVNRIPDFENKVLANLEYCHHGVEGVWGKIIPAEKAFTAFDSGVNHYMASVDPKCYSTWLARVKYGVIRKFYIIRRKLMG